MHDSTIHERHKRFESVIKPYMADLQRFIHSMTRDAEVTNDILAETFYRAYRNFDALREPNAAKSWLFTIARREFYETLQKNKRMEQLTDDHDEGFEDYNSLPDQKADVSFLHEALERLPAKQKEAILLFEVYGFSLAEIQEMQSDSLSAVKQRLKRGREKLAQILGAEALPE
ncbi:MAG: RNA polymerase sigma factor [Candidatus Kapabacteria bacterium]|jgi:RNA polymerase sigma-70 factor (ECF subfamily)|nr:RNA polymerase sigma factor [Candidatus Kapabacteria bacterium]